MAELLLLIVAALQVPVIPLLDVFVNAGTAPPLQMVNDVPKLNVGVIVGLTVALIEIDFAH